MTASPTGSRKRATTISSKKNDKGQTVNRVESIFHLGTSQMDNEECAVTHQMLRSLGVVHLDHQARV